MPQSTTSASKGATKPASVKPAKSKNTGGLGRGGRGQGRGRGRSLGASSASSTNKNVGSVLPGKGSGRRVSTRGVVVDNILVLLTSEPSKFQNSYGSLARGIGVAIRGWRRVFTKTESGPI
jgi:hypothetical protein